MPRETPEPKKEKPQDVINVVYMIASIHAACVTPLLRSRFGSHAFAAYPAAGILMFAYAGFANCPLLAWYIPVWMLMVAFRRLTCDPAQHSRYQGFPWTLGWLGEHGARCLEPFVCLFGGVFLCMISQPLGEFVAAECLSMLIVLGTEMEMLRSQKRAMRDAQIQARQMSDLQRGGNGWD
jgi:hypothetical protein